jgi:hypothetical protein
MLRLQTLLALTFSALLAATLPARSQAPETPRADAGPMMVKPAVPKTLTNASIIRMAGANLSDDLIIQAINSQPGQYTTDADAMVDLKDAGVSEHVIAAMLNRNRKRLTANGEAADDPPPPPVNVNPVTEIGVYYKDRKGTWQLLETEVVHTKSGGWLKSTATHGIIKQHMNGHRVHSDNREFRTMTGGVFHSHGGAERDEVAFHPNRIGPRTYTFTIDRSVGGGEFGILPPGTGNATNSGRVFTFAITE